MRTCLIYSGETRRFRDLIDNHRWFIMRHFENPVIFASITKDENADDIPLLSNYGYEVNFEKVEQPALQGPPITTEHNFGYPPSVTQDKILRQLWALNRAWEFVSATGREFDLYIRIRPDAKFLRADIPKFKVPEKLIRGYPDIPQPGCAWAMPDLCKTPWFARWGGISDRFAILGRRAAESYFTAYTKRDALFAKGCPCHTETFLAAALEMDGIKPSHDLACEFQLLRNDGTLYPVDATSIDIAEYARI